MRAAGTNAIDYTTSDGRLSISVPPGTANIEVEYLGLDPLRHPVNVTAGGTTTFNTPMKSSVLQLDSFVVQESVRGQSLAINMQKTAAGSVNIVSDWPSPDCTVPATPAATC